MANEQLAVQLKLMADTAQLQAELRKVVTGLQGVGQAGKTSFDQANTSAQSFRSTLRDMIGRFSAFWVAFKGLQSLGATAHIGVDFLAQIENAKLGIGALITAQAKLVDGDGKQLNAQQSLNAAMAMGDEQIKKLRISGLQTAATTEQLVSAYQDAVGGGLRAGMSLDQIRVLTVQTVQAAGAMGVPMNQLNQEIRSILDGTIDRNSRVAIRLGITNAEVTQWRNAGTLFENLNKKMGAFTEAGKESMNNWTVILSNIQEATQILMGDIMRNPFGELKAALNDVLMTIVDVKTANISKEMANIVAMGQDLAKYFGQALVAALNFSIQLLRDLADWWVANRNGVNGFIETLKGLIGGVLSGLWSLLVVVVKLFADLAAWLGTTSEGFRAAAITALVFVGVVKGMAATQAAATVALAASSDAVMGLGMGAAKASSSLSSYTAGIVGMFNPVVLVTAAIAALAVAVIYLAGAEERAHKAKMERNKENASRVSEYQRMAKDYLAQLDAIKASKKPTEDLEEEYARLADTRKALSQAFPELAAVLHDETLGRKAVVDLLGAENKGLIDSLRTKRDLLETTLATKNAEIGAEVAGGPQLDMSGSSQGWEAGLAKMELQAKRAAQELEQVNKQLSDLNKPIDADKINLIPNKRALTEAELAKIHQKENEQRELASILEASALRLLERKSLEEQKILAVRREEKKLADELRRIDAMKLMPKAEKDKAKDQLEKDSANVVLRIREEFAEKMETEEANFQTKLGIITDEGWDKKEKSLKQALAKAIAMHEEANGLVKGSYKLSAEEQIAWNKMLSDTKAQTQLKDFERLEKSWAMEKKLRREMTPEEEIVAMKAWAEANGFAAAAIDRMTAALQVNVDKRADWLGGWREGITSWLTQATDSFAQFKTLATTMLNGTQQAFTSFFASIFKSGQTGAQKWDALWKGLVGVVIQAGATMAANWLMTALVGSAVTKTALAQSGAKTAAYLTEGAAGAWAAYGWIPFIGAGLAEAQIVAMGISVAAAGMLGSAAAVSYSGAADPNDFSSATGAANGAWFDKPTLTVMGEGMQRELAVPEVSFMSWAGNFAQNLLRQEREAPAAAGGAPLPPMQFYFGHVLGESAESARIIGDKVWGVLDERQRRKA
jgi:hypothetical protein